MDREVGVAHETLIRAIGLAVAIAGAFAIGWMIASTPRTLDEAVGGVASGLGVYAIDQQAFADGLAFFRRDQFVEARAAFARADPARRDARTQFYIAYSFYREGWHVTHRDDGLFKEGLAVVDHAIAIAPDGRIAISDDNLQMKSADELRAELASGLRGEVSDLNPMRLLDRRK